MICLIDSDWVIDALKGRADAVAAVRSLAPNGLAVSVMTVAEVYEGVYYGPKPDEAEQNFQRFLSGVTVLLLTEPIAMSFARIRGQLRRTGQIIGDGDILIAATALYHGLPILTRNRKHFQRIPDVIFHEPV